MVFLRETVVAEAGRAARGSSLRDLVAAIGRPGLALLLALVFMTPFVFSGIETILALWSERALG